MADNGISTLSTKELRQIAKLNLASSDRIASGNPRAYYDITQLPTQYSDNDIVDNPNTDGLIEGRPWIEIPPTPSYALEFRAVIGEGEIGDIITTCNEGDVIWFGIIGTNVPDDPTAYLQFSGANITNADAALWSEVPINLLDSIPYNFTGTNTNGAPILIEEDNLTEGNETLTLEWIVNGTTVATTSITLVDTSTTPAPTYSFDSIPTSIDEGSAGTFNVTTTNVSNGTILYWTIATNSGDFGTTSGSFTVTSNAGSFTVTPTSDSTTEGSETFTIALRTVSTSGTVVATSSTVTINDTSTSPSMTPEQLITNSDFSGGTTGWTASGGFGTYSYSSGSQIAINPDGYPQFSYTSRTMSRNIDVSSVTNDASTFTAVVNLRHDDKNAGGYTQIDTYNFTVVYKNSSGGTVITKTTGTSNAPQNFTDITLTLNRSEIPSTFNTITTAAISLTGIDTGYWQGQHGPVVRYITLTAS